VRLGRADGRREWIKVGGAIDAGYYPVILTGAYRHRLFNPLLDPLQG
jgi:hypothetical protein